MKKFEQVATVEGSPKWENATKRECELYSPKHNFRTMRTKFDRDYTRIINCNAYRRLKHKTQVFFAPENDHICTRLEHVNSVESISHTISNCLGLNNELTKAIAVSHDLGHTSFGHQGEKILSTITEREFGEKFWHAKNGLHFVEDIELLTDHEGIKKNLNLTYGVRDGIIAHSGEPMLTGQKPRDEFIDLKDFKKSGQFAPYTWEGCVVKIADNISYMGRDIEDAKQMKLLSDVDIKRIEKVTEYVKINNSNIINYLVVDLCENSSIEKGLRFSDEAIETMRLIKEFNSQKIYKNPKIEPTIRYFTVLMSEIFYTLKNEFNGENTIQNLKKMGRYYPTLSNEFIGWLSNYSLIKERKNEEYNNKIIYNLNNLEHYERAIIDYMSGMTDNYIVKVYNEIVSF